MLKIKKGFSIFLCAVFFFSLPNISVYANTIENIKLDEFIKNEELRVQEIDDLYSKKQDLYNQYFTSKDDAILNEISLIESQLYKLGVSDFSWDDMNQKMNMLGYEEHSDLVTPNAVIPPNTSNVRWSTYRYSTVIWGRLHEMQIVMAEPIGVGPLTNTTGSIETKVSYGNAIQAIALSVFEIAAGGLAGKLVVNGVEVGNMALNLYSIASSAGVAMTSTQTFDSINYNSTASSAATFKYGFIKVNGQPDYEQKFVYRGNSVHMTYTITLAVYIFEGGVLKPKHINYTQAVYNESPSYKNIILNVEQNPNNAKSYVIYSKDEPLTNIPYKYRLTTHYHYVPGIAYVEHGLSMYSYYIFNY
ncbi:MAG: hypothetical protein K0S61_898 [Anaerocolumna sp.]|jgi:hypothetical protein|nr:hypothetical protein [Anaerocolumna sp.]